MDEARSAALRKELEAALAEREELDTFIAVLSRRLGIPEPERLAADGPETNGRAVDTARPPVESVRAAQFYGMSGPKAAKAVLEMFGTASRPWPLKTDDIFEAIKKGGAKIGSSGALYRSLHRDPIFHKVGRGLWGLTEWYPQSARRTRDSDEPPDDDGKADPSSESDLLDSGDTSPPDESTLL
jgi:hypothetical protein